MIPLGFSTIYCYQQFVLVLMSFCSMNVGLLMFVFFVCFFFLAMCIRGICISIHISQWKTFPSGKTSMYI